MNDNENDGDGARAQDLKALGRAKADELQSRIRAEGGSEFAWFDALYKNADERREFIPWSEAAPRYKLLEWLEAKARSGLDLDGLRAVDVGCGLGDNARCLKSAGLDVTAFDISQHAVEWAERNFGGEGIKFEVADIFDLPAAWSGAFDIVHETYNLQAMPPEFVEPATAALASLVAPGGTLLVMTRGRLSDEDFSGPPHPLTEDQLAGFERAGLALINLEDFFGKGEKPIRHFLAEYKNAAD